MGILLVVELLNEGWKWLHTATRRIFFLNYLWFFRMDILFFMDLLGFICHLSITSLPSVKLIDLLLLLRIVKIMSLNLLSPLSINLGANNPKECFSSSCLGFFLCLTKALGNYFIVHSDWGQKPQHWIFLVFMYFIFIHWNSLKELACYLAQQRTAIVLHPCNGLIPWVVSWDI